MIITQRIKRHEYNKWSEVLKATDGAHVTNPRDMGTYILVTYKPGDEYEMKRIFKLISTTIVEKKASRFKLIKNKLLRIFR